MADEDFSGWRATVDLDSAALVPAFDAALAEIAEALGGTLSAFEIAGGPRWRLALHSTAAPDRAALDASIAGAAAASGVAAPAVTIERVPTADWVAEYRRTARARRIGRFFVWPSHHEGGVPPDALGIRLDAGLAFGTGGHESTAGCLTAFGRLAEAGFAPARALDLGCGSGILAIAIAKLWPGAKVVACDNDPMAVQVAQENAAANGVAAAVTTELGDGYAADLVHLVRGAASFDLIAANILADPLCDMAGDCARHLAPAGRAVLSGILESQAEEVIGAHAAHGLALVARLDLGAWTTLVLGRAPVSGE